MKKTTTLLLLVLIGSAIANAKVQLPQLFQNGMVLQRGKPIPVWGVASPGQSVTATLNRKAVTATAGADGRWSLRLPAMKAGGPYELRVSDTDSETTLSDVLVGDVWLCSGQSNIDVTVERVYPQYSSEIDTYENSRIRMFRVQTDADTHGEKADVKPTPINWKPLNRQNAWAFSAVGYFLGKRMMEETGVPQGVIVNSLGGTPIEAWICADSLRRDFPLAVRQTELYQDSAMIVAQLQANQLADCQWYAVMNRSDPGMQQASDGVSPQFAASEYDDSDWDATDQYAVEWAKIGGRSVIGSIWMRQHVHVDHAHAGQPARLLLGTLFDCDYTFVNGRQVGVTYYQYPPRRYDIPEGLLHEGDNVIAVRFVNKYGTAHFIKEKPYLIAFGDNRFSQNPMPADTIALSRQWKTHIGAEMPSCPNGSISVQNLPSVLYNAMLYPLAPYGLSGVVWYQGESNTGDPDPYESLLAKMIGNWRALWQQPDLPFVVVQLANFMEPSAEPQPQSGWARLREAQRRVAERLPQVELATAIDLGETVDIHPLRKKEVAERCALAFDRMVYGKKVSPFPKVTDARLTAGGAVRLVLNQPLKSGELYEFELCGSDGRFRNARAEADGVYVTVSCSEVTAPVKVRYAWKNNPIRANACAQSGLPLAPMEIEVRK